MPQSQQRRAERERHGRGDKQRYAQVDHRAPVAEGARTAKAMRRAGIETTTRDIKGNAAPVRAD
jgi:hypothetical protein